MARLLHLNGPPGVGKSSLARAYADDHPGVLVLDGVVVVAMIAGWREDFWSTLPVARRLAVAMCREHLLSGSDVVLPELVTSPDEISPYLAAAERAGAGYVEVVLLADMDTTLQRFAQRSSMDAVGRQVGEIVAAGGGRELLAKIRGDLLAHLGTQASHLTIDTTGLLPADAYRALRALLDG